MENDFQLTPTRPYMVRAIFEWLEDNNLTPHIMVDTTQPNVTVPVEYVQDGRIVLNIASRATGNLVINNDFINFHARFGGVSQELWVPMQAVMGIYARENSQGMFFDPTEYDNAPQSEINASQPAESTEVQRPKRENKAGLKILD
ncbi:MAG: ClpXP protease specificity-enhancing factor [Moraxella sp.]|jgi:stringent starvation protein B|uniref:ClpXP protease specificity-enhancing factor n=1 Tax=Faucicola osloensis TaxID=34062 RepID=A0A6P1KB21_FAUOS|nr:ClpXP protease specificity-enhancing factor [Moraxella osloensis]MBP6341895.1 ClpXP protease specificity-enhancing factor [Moraxella sp.]MBP7234879.1 ClpXP protease specificity-enhancing factor [Moraxella sp.]QHG09058.1 ClpXP protease specificity-enhancing factor [Moraxella osloensis]